MSTFTSLYIWERKLLDTARKKDDFLCFVLGKEGRGYPLGRLLALQSAGAGAAGRIAGRGGLRLHYIGIAILI